MGKVKKNTPTPNKMKRKKIKKNLVVRKAEFENMFKNRMERMKCLKATASSQMNLQLRNRNIDKDSDIVVVSKRKKKKQRMRQRTATSTPMSKSRVIPDIPDEISFIASIKGTPRAISTIVISDDEDNIVDLTKPSTELVSTAAAPCVIDLCEEEPTPVAAPSPTNEIAVVETHRPRCLKPKRSLLSHSLIRIQTVNTMKSPMKKKTPKRKPLTENVSKPTRWGTPHTEKNVSNHTMWNAQHTNKNVLKPTRWDPPHAENQVRHESVKDVGQNVYIEQPTVFPKSGLRPVIIDGSNVAFSHSCNKYFSCKGLELCINYFKSKGHWVVAFVPQFRVKMNHSDNPKLLERLADAGEVVLTPSRRVDGRNIVSYDDRYIVQTAVVKGGVIVTNDNYRDLLQENQAWADTIKYRVLSFTWVGDILMFPVDPLGKNGPTLSQFLNFS